MSRTLKLFRPTGVREPFSIKNRTEVCKSLDMAALFRALLAKFPVDREVFVPYHSQHATAPSPTTWCQSDALTGQWYTHEKPTHAPSTLIARGPQSHSATHTLEAIQRPRSRTW